MPEDSEALQLVDGQVARLFALVTSSLADATSTLLNGDVASAQRVIDGDQEIDNLTNEIVSTVWDLIETEIQDQLPLRHLVNLLLIVPELERSADLAEHIAQRHTRFETLEVQ